MLGGSCSKCCTKCSPYMDARAIEVDITGSDWIASCGVNPTFPVGLTVGYGWPGASLAGTWSLNRTAVTAASNTWSSKWGGPICGVEYKIEIKVFAATLGGEVVLSAKMLGALIEATRPANRRDAFTSISEMAGFNPQRGIGNARDLEQYCHEVRVDDLPVINVPGRIPFADTADPFNRLVDTCNPNRVTVGSYLFGITAIRVYV